MTIIAKTEPGKEYIYSLKSVHKVNARKAAEICETLNRIRWQLSGREAWYIYSDITEYEPAHDYAMLKEFTLYKGVLKEKRY